MINSIVEKSCENVSQMLDEKPESVGAILQRNPLVQEALSKNNLSAPVLEEYNSYSAVNSRIKFPVWFSKAV